VWLTRALGGCEESCVKGVLEEGVTQVALIYHKESVGEADPSEAVGICVDPVRFVSFSPSFTGRPLRGEKGTNVVLLYLLHIKRC